MSSDKPTRPTSSKGSTTPSSTSTNVAHGTRMSTGGQSTQQQPKKGRGRPRISKAAPQESESCDYFSDVEDFELTQKEIETILYQCERVFKDYASVLTWLEKHLSKAIEEANAVDATISQAEKNEKVTNAIAWLKFHRVYSCSVHSMLYLGVEGEFVRGAGLIDPKYNFRKLLGKDWLGEQLKTTTNGTDWFNDLKHNFQERAESLPLAMCSIPYLRMKGGCNLTEGSDCRIQMLWQSVDDAMTSVVKRHRVYYDEGMVDFDSVNNFKDLFAIDSNIVFNCNAWKNTKLVTFFKGPNGLKVNIHMQDVEKFKRQLSDAQLNASEWQARLKKNELEMKALEGTKPHTKTNPKTTKHSKGPLDTSSEEDQLDTSSEEEDGSDFDISNMNHSKKKKKRYCSTRPEVDAVSKILLNYAATQKDADDNVQSKYDQVLLQYMKLQKEENTFSLHEFFLISKFQEGIIRKRKPKTASEKVIEKASEALSLSSPSSLSVPSSKGQSPTSLVITTPSAKTTVCFSTQSSSRKRPHSEKNDEGGCDTDLDDKRRHAFNKNTKYRIHRGMTLIAVKVISIIIKSLVDSAVSIIEKALDSDDEKTRLEMLEQLHSVISGTQALHAVFPIVHEDHTLTLPIKTDNRTEDVVLTIDDIGELIYYCRNTDINNGTVDASNKQLLRKTGSKKRRNPEDWLMVFKECCNLFLARTRALRDKVKKLVTKCDEETQQHLQFNFEDAETRWKNIQEMDPHGNKKKKQKSSGNEEAKTSSEATKGGSKASTNIDGVKPNDGAKHLGTDKQQEINKPTEQPRQTKPINGGEVRNSDKLHAHHDNNSHQQLVYSGIRPKQLNDMSINHADKKSPIQVNLKLCSYMDDTLSTIEDTSHHTTSNDIMIVETIKEDLEYVLCESVFGDGEGQLCLVMSSLKNPNVILRKYLNLLHDFTGYEELKIQATSMFKQYLKQYALFSLYFPLDMSTIIYDSDGWVEGAMIIRHIARSFKQTDSETFPQQEKGPTTLEKFPPPPIDEVANVLAIEEARLSLEVEDESIPGYRSRENKLKIALLDSIRSAIKPTGTKVHQHMNIESLFFLFEPTDVAAFLLMEVDHSARPYFGNGIDVMRLKGSNVKTLPDGKSVFHNPVCHQPYAVLESLLSFTNCVALAHYLPLVCRWIIPKLPNGSCANRLLELALSDVASKIVEILAKISLEHGLLEPEGTDLISHVQLLLETEASNSANSASTPQSQANYIPLPDESDLTRDYDDIVNTLAEYETILDRDLISELQNLSKQLGITDPKETLRRAIKNMSKESPGNGVNNK